MILFFFNPTGTTVGRACMCVCGGGQIFKNPVNPWPIIRKGVFVNFYLFPWVTFIIYIIKMLSFPKGVYRENIGPFSIKEYPTTHVKKCYIFYKISNLYNNNANVCLSVCVSVCMKHFVG